MSTTVSYKNNTLTTVDNETKILSTAGKYMEDDITLVDTTSGGAEVLVVDTPDAAGGTIREITVTESVRLQGQKEVALTSSPQTVTPDAGYDGFASIVVDAGTIGTVTQDENGYLVLSPNGGGGATVTGLSATYNQSGTVDVHDSLSSLVKDLTVTATIGGTLSIELAPSEYTLSGTLTAGTSTITVSYEGQITTFTVTVTDYWDYYWDYTSGVLPPDWTFYVNGENPTYSITSTGLAMYSPAINEYVYIYPNSYTTTTDGTLEVTFSTDAIPTSASGIRISVSNGTTGGHVVVNNGYLKLYTSSTASNQERLMVATTGIEYTARIHFTSETAPKAGYNINNAQLRTGLSTSNILYATGTRIWSQGLGGTLLVKTIKYKEGA